LFQTDRVRPAPRLLQAAESGRRAASPVSVAPPLAASSVLLRSAGIFWRFGCVVPMGARPQWCCLTAPDPAQTATEVLVEPGSHQVWVTFADAQTCRVDLTPLLTLDTHRSLRLPRVFAAVALSPAGRGLHWPGGVQLDSGSVRLAPVGGWPVRPVACLPAHQRYRPLLPYLHYQDPPLQAQPLPVDRASVQRQLQLRPGELDQILRHSPVAAEILLPRLSDLATLLTGHFPGLSLAVLLRRPWRHSTLRYPSSPFLHTMLGCLQFGRPDLIEQPCLLLLTGLP
jgi:Protein of unknown function (DUF2442)